MPREGDTVTIPAGKTVVLDTSPPRLAGLQVNGALRFKDKNLNLSSDWIVVHGKLEVGTERTPFRSKARIVLTGDDETQNIMNMGAKVLGVMGGVLDIHGQERRGWTRLAANAAKGSGKITMGDASAGSSRRPWHDGLPLHILVGQTNKESGRSYGDHRHPP